MSASKKTVPDVPILEEAYNTNELFTLAIKFFRQWDSAPQAKAIGPIFADAEMHIEEQHKADLSLALRWMRSLAHTTNYEVSYNFTPDDFEVALKKKLDEYEQSNERETPHDEVGNSDNTYYAAVAITGQLHEAGMWSH